MKLVNVTSIKQKLIFFCGNNLQGPSCKNLAIAHAEESVDR